MTFVRPSTEDSCVALEDRDWYREEPSKEWNRIFRRPDPPQGTSTFDVRGNPKPAPVAGRRMRRVRRRVGRWLAAVALAAVIGLGLTFVSDHRETLRDATDWAASLLDNSPHGLASPAPLSPAPVPMDPPVPLGPTPVPPAPNDGKVVHLRSRPGLDVPAQRVARWWVTDPRFGRVSVYVPVGKTPREALTVALAERGYQVVP